MMTLFLYLSGPEGKARDPNYEHQIYFKKSNLSVYDLQFLQ